jgi:acyl dehydratase
MHAAQTAVPLARAHELLGQRLFTTDWLPVARPQLEAFDYAIDAVPGGADLAISKANPLGGDLINGIWLLARAVTVFFDYGPIREPGLWGLNYGYEKVRFLWPVFVGGEVRYTAVLQEVRDHPQGRLLVTLNEVEVRGSAKPAAVFTSLALCSTQGTQALT